MEDRYHRHTQTMEAEGGMMPLDGLRMSERIFFCKLFWPLRRADYATLASAR